MFFRSSEISEKKLTTLGRPASAAKLRRLQAGSGPFPRCRADVHKCVDVASIWVAFMFRAVLVSILEIQFGKANGESIGVILFYGVTSGIRLHSTTAFENCSHRATAASVGNG